MRSPLIDDEDELDVELDIDPDVEVASEAGPPPLRSRDYETQIRQGHRQPRTTDLQRSGGVGTRSPWETLPREGATAAQAERFAKGDATVSHKVQGIAREYAGIRG